ncbi:hypothetical protein [Alteromonas sp. ASW11-130]|uniref:hypothetical protein n=1 Tax=Alteromonas sp. ASW11-130 TaxID=3015775 RepID=UPI002242AF5B|nr:hypothetical protein [Alteromonas sp. ASW11-130]MCW8092597.1 hypothetical protein [Alteromonas sp. ASW11-130]
MSSPKLVAPPRNFIWEFLLFFCTGGLYSMLWFRLIARDCKHICGKPDSPILWLLVPLIPPAQPFALPHLFAAIRECEKQINIRPWPVIFDYVWIAIMFTCSFYFWVSFFIETRIKIDLIVLVLWIGWQMLLHIRMNRVRKRRLHEPMMPRYVGFNVVEWATIGLFLPILLTLFSWLFYFTTNQSM